ncbi:MAG: polymerase sigma-70 factor, subfamily [Actinomycetota bacterium]|jgi:RNA polymerase sigma-70 factor (ECF subfamily)|nr:polymerase sigma-70 factor, subfamily [Actinomycetota bacterium]MEA2587189.1 polymerase sigma-70 factor, subfamily [Actinomycetota bacterium]
MWIADLEALGDEELVRRFVSDGSSDAVDVLLRRHQDRVLGLAYRILGNRADALDASQEVFVAVFRKAASFRHQSAFTTWLYRLTVNACNDHARRRSRLPQPAEVVDVASPDAVGRADDRLVIAGAMRKLPLEQRTAVIMRDLLGLSYDEIAQATDTAVGTVKSRISRGRAALAGGLGERPEPEPGEAPARLSPKKP